MKFKQTALFICLTLSAGAFAQDQEQSESWWENSRGVKTMEAYYSSHLSVLEALEEKSEAFLDEWNRELADQVQIEKQCLLVTENARECEEVRISNMRQKAVQLHQESIDLNQTILMTAQQVARYLAPLSHSHLNESVEKKLVKISELKQAILAENALIIRILEQRTLYK